MDPDREICTSSPIEGLSVEILRMILSEISHVSSLRAAVISCPLLYNAFILAEETITAQVLHRQIDISVLPETLAAYESSRLPLHRPDPDRLPAIKALIRTLRTRPLPLPGSGWTLRYASHVGGLHQIAALWAKKLATAALSRDPLNVPGAAPATDQELHRFERALLRFEVFCNIFRDLLNNETVYYDEEQALFFNNFTPWENEQLGCVHDLLIRAVAPAFNEIAEHDVSWGTARVDYRERLDSPWMQHLLSLGLEKLYEITEAQSYEDRYRLLTSFGCPKSTGAFLREGLECFPNDLDYIHDYETPVARRIQEMDCFKPAFDDPNRNPRDIWQSAHLRETYYNWVYQKDRDGLRQWGYVMWNDARLDAAGVYYKSWPELGFKALEESESERLEAAKLRDDMQKSWEQRERIHRMGGRGWWSWGDESRVQWKGGSDPRHG